MQSDYLRPSDFLYQPYHIRAWLVETLELYSVRLFLAVFSNKILDLGINEFYNVTLQGK